MEQVRPDAGAMFFIKFKKKPHGGVEAFCTRLLARNIGWRAQDTCFRLDCGWPTWYYLRTGLGL